MSKFKITSGNGVKIEYNKNVRYFPKNQLKLSINTINTDTFSVTSKNGQSLYVNVDVTQDSVLLDGVPLVGGTAESIIDQLDTVLFTTPSGAGAVDSFNTRTGAVVSVAGDYNSDQVTNSSGVAGALVSDALDQLDSDIPADTDDLSEGSTNLYYTEGRVSANASVVANTAKVTNATHTGDVTGATALTIANDAVTNEKLANMEANSVKVNNTGSSADPTNLTMAASTMLSRLASGNIVAATVAQVRTLLGIKIPIRANVYFNSNATTTNVGSTAALINATYSTYSSENSSDFTVTTGGRITYTGSGTFTGNIYLTVTTPSSGNGQRYNIFVAKVGTTVTPGHGEEFGNAGDLSNAVAIIPATLTTNQYVEPFINNTTATVNMSPDKLMMVIQGHV